MESAARLLQTVTFCPIFASGLNFNPRNILYIPVVKVFTFFELEQKLAFFKGLAASLPDALSMRLGEGGS